LATLAVGVPTIVMGDLNAGEPSAEVRTLIGAGDNTAMGRALLDSYRQLHPQRKPNEASFGGWEGRTEGRRIDFILHTDEFTPTAAAIVRTNYDGRWPSDHYPVTATLRLEATP
jgi:endonuclease/exonuclease/phosphatase family metal-dependent hydrolase